MNRKQKKMLLRIILSSLMLVGFHFIGVSGIWRFA